MYTKKIAAVCFLLVGGSIASTAYADDFVNGGFESNSLTGWTQGGGSFTSSLSSPYILDASAYVGGTPTNSVVGVGNDPILFAAGVTLSRVYSGNYAVRVNDSNNNQSVSTVSQTVANYGSTSINFAWSAVLEGASHGQADTDSFSLKIVDNTTSTVIKSISYNAAAPSTSSLFTYNSTAGVYYSGWQSETVTTIAGHSYTITCLLPTVMRAGIMDMFT